MCGSGYISGSDGRRTGKTVICGILLPDGLKESDKLPQPIFTPSTKEEIGQHDINIDYDEVYENRCRSGRKGEGLSLDIYRRGAALAEQKGIIIADTKFEFGCCGDDLSSSTRS